MPNFVMNMSPSLNSQTTAIKKNDPKELPKYWIWSTCVVNGKMWECQGLERLSADPAYICESLNYILSGDKDLISQ